MGKKYFDKNIKDKLEGLEIKYDASSWEAFEEKLDDAIAETQLEDAAFDEQIKAKVGEDLNFEYNDADWQELSQQIDYENELVNRIYLFKILELVILVLLAYSFFQIEPIKKSNKKPLYAHSEIFKKIDQNKIAEKIVSQNNLVQDNLQPQNPISSLINDRIRIELSALNPIAFTKFEKLVFAEKATISVPSFSSEINVNATNDKIAKAQSLQTSDQDIAAIESIEIKPLDSEIKDIALLPSIAQKGTEKWVSFSGSADINLVNTPTSFLINGRDQLLNSTGFSSNVGYSIKSGKNEYEIGFGYSYKNYDPGIREVFNVDGSSLYAYSLNRIVFHVAQIPATYKRYFVDNSKWSAYAAVGATHNFILFSDYNLTDELLSGIWSPKDYRKANSDLLRRDYFTGLLQNVDQPSLKRSSSREFKTEGDIFDNAFITSYAGLGLQRNLGFDRSIFVQAGYHHQFFGDKLGPNKDQINTFSFTLGGKFRI